MSAEHARSVSTARRLKASITRDPAMLEAAQRLRYRIFSEEYDSDLGALTPGIDQDTYDAHCDHLIVTDVQTGQLVATSRVLHQRDAEKTGGFYSEGEFELENLYQLPGQLAELGRTCVHPDYRNGATISLLWSSVAEYLVRENVDYMIGCASISMADGGHKAWRITQQLQQRYMTDRTQRVSPRRALPHITNASGYHAVDIPPLIRAYMRLGARVCGEPCWDPEFRCADLLVLLEVKKLASRYSRHFMRPAEEPGSC
ncbi:L-ornithine N(alpha)-acyltransferase [Marinobacter nanhaiticus D15-8W]|uniref:L-ornithine N(alpha)-acyltransferase n=1 Tax=Marinobacter nanhaiticus D15-8W TaxID=626887 RepID=N6WZW9_9GAMM|nr:GNAT family N-acyltransferase [Marinobacter nanhaiticus]ENO16717.1 GNAT family N-acetyltransferase [Marinobacter nanhaiticus D15-8W]BES72519.1 L-ornithine N(alpha)-acyltransferase [Marinobacter nanhaiticus D15-8W]